MAADAQSATALRALVQEVFEKCDVVQQVSIATYYIYIYIYIYVCVYT